MIAALPMYDRPEIRDATDRFWVLIRDHLRAHGLDAPDALTRDRDPWEVWQSPDLLLAQTCGLPFRARLHASVSLVATPDYGLPGCGPGQYNSVVIARDTRLPALPRIAINDALSQSGWAALHDWAATTGQPFGPRVFTGAHAASVAAVARGAADLCAIDAQTWRLITRAEPQPGLTEIARTAPGPALPYITARDRDPAPIRAALHHAATALTAADRAALGLRGIVDIPARTYLDVPIPPNP